MILLEGESVVNRLDKAGQDFQSWKLKYSIFPSRVQQEYTVLKYTKVY